jgi:hypothetical protein
MEKRLLRIGTIAIFVAILALVMAAPQAQAAEYWKSKFITFSAVAGATLATGDVVCLDTFDGYAYKADADLGSRKIPVGVIGKGGATGATVEIVVSGVLAGQTKGSPGSKLYLSATAGAFTTTQPEVGYELGWILPNVEDSVISESTNYFVRIQPNPVSQPAASTGKW